ncbi:hypothetical protein HDV63DRAFT_368094 [Trichoderma sp. SZMC 28014]
MVGGVAEVRTKNTTPLYPLFAPFSPFSLSSPSPLGAGATGGLFIIAHQAGMALAMAATAPRITPTAERTSVQVAGAGGASILRLGGRPGNHGHHGHYDGNHRHLRLHRRRRRRRWCWCCCWCCCWCWSSGFIARASSFYIHQHTTSMMEMRERVALKHLQALSSHVLKREVGFAAQVPPRHTWPSRPLCIVVSVVVVAVAVAAVRIALEIA